MEENRNGKTAGGRVPALAIADVLAFIKRHCVQILLRGMVSLVIVVAIVLAYLAYAPRSECYKLELQISLPEKNGILVYENGMSFSTSDVVAAPLLQELWSEYGFAQRGIKFKDFSSSFAIYNWNKDRAAIDAELSSKLSKRNITVADIALAQKTYDEKLATLDKHSFVLTYATTGVSSDRDAISRMLADLPVRWAAQSKRVYAPVIPDLADAVSVKYGLARISKLSMSEFDTIDYLQQYCRRLMETCTFIRTIMKDKNLDCDGITIGKLSARIELAKREINQLFVSLLVSPNQNKDSARFAKGRREAFTRDITTIERQIEAIKNAVSTLSPNTVVGEKCKDSNFTLQADGNFLGQYTDLVKQSLHAEEIAKYIDDQVKLETELAEIKSRDLAYAQVEQSLTSATATTTTTVDDNLKALIDSVISIGSDVERFRDYAMENCLLPGDFFKVQAPVYYAKSYKLSLPRFIAGIFAIWVIVNVVGLVFLWNRSEC